MTYDPMNNPFSFDEEEEEVDSFVEEASEQEEQKESYTLEKFLEEHKEGKRFFFEEDLHGLVFDGVDLPETSFAECDLHESNLSHCGLQRAKFREANLLLTDLSNANCTGADFYGACLSGSDMGYGNFEGASFDGATLEEVDLGCTNLAGANFAHADLSHADLRQAVIKQTDFYEADFSGATFDTGCHEIIAEILRHAAVNAATDSFRKRMLAGLVLVSKDWCWSEFAHGLCENGMTDLFVWALSVLEDWECLQSCTQLWKRKISHMLEVEERIARLRSEESNG